MRVKLPSKHHFHQFLRLTGFQLLLQEEVIIDGKFKLCTVRKGYNLCAGQMKIE